MGIDQTIIGIIKRFGTEAGSIYYLKSNEMCEALCTKDFLGISFGDLSMQCYLLL
jgi:hypothetical protein